MKLTDKYSPSDRWKHRRLPAAEKFHMRIVSKRGCWQWDKPNGHTGYGVLRSGGQFLLAHRLAYEIYKGEIPDGMQIDHICRNRGCVNPAHLRAVTSQENTLCGESLIAKNARKTHCIRGHEFTPENTYWFGHNKNQRMCRACQNMRNKARSKKCG